MRAIELAVTGVRELKPYQPGKPVEQLERELGITQAIKLASNENPLGPSPAVLKALTGSSNDLNRYPDAGAFQLKKALANFHQVEHDQVTLGNGSNDILDLVARVFVAPGKGVIFSEYAFLVYPLVTKLVGGQAIVTPAVQWGHDLDAMLDAITDNTRLIMIANPNNPTGTWLDKQDLQQFLNRCPEHVIVVLDEAYHDYVQMSGYESVLSYLSDYPNLIVTRTFSKIYGLANLRVGYGIASAEITDLLNRARQPFNVNGVGQLAALAALEDQDHVVQSKQLNQQEMVRLTGILEKWNIQYITSAGNFLAIEFGSESPKIYQQLLGRGVIVRPIQNYGMPEHLRITLGLESENNRLITELSTLVNG